MDKLTAFLKAAATLAPVILMLFPKLAPLAGPITEGIQEAEQIPGASGWDKLTHATQVAKDGIAALNAAEGKQVVDPALSDETIQAGINAVVGSLNIVHQFKAATATPGV